MSFLEFITQKFGPFTNSLQPSNGGIDTINAKTQIEDSSFYGVYFVDFKGLLTVKCLLKLIATNVHIGVVQNQVLVTPMKPQ